jgi:hypothetical protein
MIWPAGKEQVFILAGIGRETIRKYVLMRIIESDSLRSCPHCSKAYPDVTGDTLSFSASCRVDPIELLSINDHQEPL